MKTFKVKTDKGEVEAQLLASFVGYVKGQGYIDAAHLSGANRLARAA